MATSPTKLTLDWLRDDGWTAEVVEYWNAFARRRIDFLGGIDIIALREGTTLGVQCTTTAHQAERCAKLGGLPAIATWLTAGNQLWVVGWAKKGPRGKRKTWQATVTELTAEGGTIIQTTRFNGANHATIS